MSRTYLPSTSLDAATLAVGGEAFAGRGLLPEAVRAKAREALATGQPLRMTIRALGGHISKPFAFTAEFLESLAATAGGRPVFRRIHEGSLLSYLREPEVEGVIEAARVSADGRGLDEDIAVHGREALEELAMGVAPAYSIQWRSGPESALSCSACGEAATADHAAETGHWPGDVLEGQRVDVVFGGRGELVETTRTYVPAADGTHVRGLLSEDVLDRAADWLAERIAARAALREDTSMVQRSPATRGKLASPEPGESRDDFMGRCQAGGESEEACEMAWSESQPQAAGKGQALTLDERQELTRLRAERMADRAILEELQAEREERTLAARRQLAFREVSRTGLKLTVDALTQILAEPTEEGLRQILAATPSTTRTRIPAAGDPPEELSDRLLTDREAMRLHCERLAAQSGETYEAVYYRESKRLRAGGA